MSEPKWALQSHWVAVSNGRPLEDGNRSPQQRTHLFCAGPPIKKIATQMNCGHLGKSRGAYEQIHWGPKTLLHKSAESHKGTTHF